MSDTTIDLRLLGKYIEDLRVAVRALDVRLDSQQHAMDAAIRAVLTQMVQVDARLDQQLTGIKQQLTGMDQRLAGLDDHLARIEALLTK